MQIKTTLPKQFLAALVTEFGKPLKLADVEIPQIQDNEVLIKVEAAPINPSDLKFIVGQYPSGKILPVSPGNEGSGTVVQVGSNVPLRYQSGTRVCFRAGLKSGSYSQYSLTEWSNLIKLDDDLCFEDAASAFINPITVIGMLQTTKQLGAKSVVHNVAASALGRMFHKYFNENGVNVINIVRRQEQVNLLKSEGAELVLNETEQGFNEQLREITRKYEANVLFDPVAGDRTPQLLELLPDGSTAFIYGTLGGWELNNLSVPNFLYQDKTLKGYIVSNKIFRQKNSLILPASDNQQITAQFSRLKDIVIEVQNDISVMQQLDNQICNNKLSGLTKEVNQKDSKIAELNYRITKRDDEMNQYQDKLDFCESNLETANYKINQVHTILKK